MSLKRLLLFIFTIASISNSNGHAASGELDSLIETALKNFPALIAAQNKKESARFKADASGTLPNPKLNLAAVNLPLSSLSFDETPMSGVVVGLSQKIPWFGKLGSKKKIARAQEKIEEQNLFSMENQLIQMVSASYYDFLFWREAAKILKEKKEFASLLEESAELKYSHGISSLESVLRARILIEKVGNKMLDYENNRLNAQSRLSYFSNVDYSDPVLINEMSSLETVTIRSFDLSTGEISNPDINKAKMNFEKADAFYSLRKKAYYPDFTFGVDYRIRKFTAMDPVAGEDFLSLKVGISLPLWAKSKEKNSVRSAKYLVETARANERAVRSNINKQLFDINNKLATTASKLENYETKILPDSKDRLKAAFASYEEGKASFDRIYDALQDYFEYRIQKINLLRNYNTSLARLDELTGKR